MNTENTNTNQNSIDTTKDFYVVGYNENMFKAQVTKLKELVDNLTPDTQFTFISLKDDKVNKKQTGTMVVASSQAKRVEFIKQVFDTLESPLEKRILIMELIAAEMSKESECDSGDHAG